MDIASCYPARHQAIELCVERLESELARLRSDVAEMKRREQLASDRRRFRRELVVDTILNVLHAVMLAIVLVALAHGFKWHQLPR